MASQVRKDLHENNRQSWNAATRAHNSHKGDQAAFFRNGGTTTFSEEVELLGDIAGKSLVHLMCNAGQDTLSLATLGAQVLGVDISDEAISFARSLARDADIPARFERADVYDWLSGTDERFEIAFSSYGVLGWLSDLSTWARGIARILEPGGRFVLLEFHSMIYMFEDALSGTDGAAGAGSEDEPLGERLRLRYAYSGGAHYSMEEGVSDYVAASEDGLCPQGYETGIENFANPHRSEEFAWGIEDTVSAILDAGLHLTCLREYPYSAGCRQFPFMKDIGGRRYALPGGPQGVPYIPHMFGLIAVKP